MHTRQGITRLRMSPCGMRGRIVLKDGTRSPHDLYSKEAALEDLARLVLKKTVTGDEAMALRAQIAASSLCETDHQFNMLFCMDHAAEDGGDHEGEGAGLTEWSDGATQRMFH